MAEPSYQAFAAAAFAGQQLNADLDNKRAETEQRKQETVANKADLAFKQQQQQMQQQQQAQLSKLIATHDAEMKQQQTADGSAPDDQKSATLTQEAKFYSDLAKTFDVSNPAMAEKYRDLATKTEDKRSLVEKRNLEVAEKQTKDIASYAGGVLEGDVSSNEAFTWVKDHMGLKAAMSIPSDPKEAKLWWKAKQLSGMSANEQMANARKIAEDTEKEKDKHEAAAERKREFNIREQDIVLRREQLRDSRAAAEADRVERRAKAAETADFNKSEKLNKTLQTEAKPFLEDLHRLNKISGLLDVNTSAGDQQVHQALTAALGEFKGRATNLFYKDNKNFGSVTSRLTGMLSHGFAGRYQESDRAMIRQMVNDLKNNSVEPALAKLETDQKQHAKGYKLDPDNIRIEGDFSREAKASAPSYSEGMVAKNPKTGETMVFRNGQWVKQ